MSIKAGSSAKCPTENSLSTGPVLLMRNVERTYGEVVALRHFNVSVQAGECVALLGINGSGKTTALGIAAGTITPTRGDVFVVGSPVHTEPGGEATRAATAFVPDNPLLYEDLTVREHLELVTKLHNSDPSTRNDLIERTLNRLQLSRRADYFPLALSRGMRQKTQLACVLVRPFRLLILDEPAVGLDEKSVEVLREIIEEVKRSDGAVFVSTHQRDFASECADRTLCLQDGETTPPSLSEQEVLVA